MTVTVKKLNKNQTWLDQRNKLQFHDHQPHDDDDDHLLSQLQYRRKKFWKNNADVKTRVKLMKEWTNWMTDWMNEEYLLLSLVVCIFSIFFLAFFRNESLNKHQLELKVDLLYCCIFILIIIIVFSISKSRSVGQKKFKLFLFFFFNILSVKVFFLQSWNLI